MLGNCYQSSIWSVLIEIPTYIMLMDIMFRALTQCYFCGHVVIQNNDDFSSWVLS